MFAVSLKKKLLLTISLLAILASLVSSAFLSYLSLTEMEKDALVKAEADLTAKRVLVTAELSNYIGTIEKQAKVMANDVSIKEAAKSFSTAFFNFDKSLVNKNSLINYYENQFRPRYNDQNTDTLTASSLYNSLTDISVALQSQFISLNPSPLGEKDKLNSIGDGSEYDELHERYHSTVRTFLKEFGYYDVFIVEPKQGYIVYSVFKELDFATSLKFGPYKDSGIAEAFNEGLKLQNGQTYLTDFKPYLPSYNNAASFISSPIFDGSQLVGVLIFQMPIDRLNALMTQKGKWANSGFGASGAIYLVGQDKTLRNESRFFVEDKYG
jgi:methyl-accepting chemotaxis protein